MRIHITWADEKTLKIETDAGQQTRLLQFGAGPASGPRTLQGHSVAEWVLPPGQNTGQPRWGSLKVVTTNMTAAWLRKNGVPYSEQALMTEHFDTFSDGATDWFTVTTLVEDPTYLTAPFSVSSNFKKEPDGSKWAPSPCVN